MKVWLRQKLSNSENIDSRFTDLIEQARQVILGKDFEIKLALATLMARGHLLIEDVPGVGKTTFVMCLAKLLGLSMKRIQFTNDLLPADILGTSIYDTKNQSFTFHPGPIFSQVVLGDELNRASAKTQSAFLQAMEEHQVTVDGKNYELPNPFFIIATQNPQTQVGTNPLPESQLDRFMMRLTLGMPDADSEKKLLAGGDPRERLKELSPIMSLGDLLTLQKRVQNVHASDALVRYVYDLLAQSRSRGQGLSPRAGLVLVQAAKAWALLNGRDMVLPEDVQDVAPSVMNHRLQNQSLKAEEIIKSVAIP